MIEAKMRTIVVLVLYVILALLLIPVLLVCYLGKWTKPIMAPSKWALHFGKWILGVDLKVYGLEGIDKKASYIFMANHLSFLDGPLLFMIIPQYVRVILKKEVFKIPIVGQGMRHVGFIPVDRKKLKGGKKSIDKASQIVKEKGFSFLIFPEGTRSRTGSLQPFKRGGFFLAFDSQAPIVPVTINGTYELMPRGSFFVKRGKIKVDFHKPLPVGRYDQDKLPSLVERVRGVIQSGLEEEG